MDRRKPKKDKNDNPFSFRNFLTTAPNNGESNLVHTHSSNQSENTNNNVFGNRRRDLSDRITNPYSFARFLCPQSEQSSRPTQSVRGDNGMIVQGELPDFVQDHFSVSNGGLGNLDHNHPKNSLPDFTQHTTIDNNTSNTSLPFYSHRSTDFHLISSSSPLQIRANHNANEHHLPINSGASATIGAAITPDDELPRLAGSNSSNLPDFLSDTCINIAAKDTNESTILPLNYDLVMPGTSSHHHNGAIYDPGEEVILSARIIELEEEVAEKNVRILQLEQQLAEQRRKEEEETEIMESMMRQVDENLERAVERWKTSEREVERLNARINELKVKLSQGQEGSQVPMHIVRHIGSQLGSDLIAADEIMKRFLEHSDKMKILAGHLQYFDRVEDISQSDAEHLHPS